VTTKMNKGYWKSFFNSRAKHWIDTWLYLFAWSFLVTTLWHLVWKRSKKTNYQWLILNSYTALWVFFYGVGYLQLEFSELQTSVFIHLLSSWEFFYVCCMQKEMPLDLSWLRIGKLTTFQDWHTAVLFLKKLSYVKSSKLIWFNSNTY